MPKSKDSSFIREGDWNHLNFVLARMSDRLDKLEGLRTELETESGTFNGTVTAPLLLVQDDDETEIHSLGET